MMLQTRLHFSLKPWIAWSAYTFSSEHPCQKERSLSQMSCLSLQFWCPCYRLPCGIAMPRLPVTWYYSCLYTCMYTVTEGRRSSCLCLYWIHGLNVRQLVWWSLWRSLASSLSLWAHNVQLLVYRSMHPGCHWRGMKPKWVVGLYYVVNTTWSMQVAS